MKNRVWLLVLLLVRLGSVAAQDSVDPNRLPPEGTRLNAGWRWHPGDDPAWANPDFDDRHWAAVDPSQPLAALPALQSARRGWFRLHVPSGSMPLVLEAQQAGYSTVFFNGKPCAFLGEIPVQNGTVESFLLEPDAARPGDHVLCLRYTPPPRFALINPDSRPVALVTLRPAAAGRWDFERLFRLEFFSSTLRFGVFFILCLLHLVFFALMRGQAANLFFGLFALCHLLRGGLTLLWLNGVFGLQDELIEFADVSLGQFGQTLFLSATYALFRRPFDGWFWALVAFTVLTVALLPVAVFSLTTLVPLTNLLTTLLAIRVSFGAMRERLPDAGILLVGSLTYFAFRLYFTFELWFDQDNHEATGGAFLLASMSLSLCVSVLLARLHPRTNRQLEERLAEVERLSQQAVAHEQEKQHLLATQNERLDELVTTRTAELRQSLDDLRSTQAQLIQSEKMASLGELTAGIAHEIQNPLNFVNNFSEVSVELIDELHHERQKTNLRDEELIDELLDDLRQNLQKITHHGRRADSIVKGMLQHSRASTGQKEPTDLNALAEEYLRLSYHGLRAKDKTFNATLKTDFDPRLGRVEVVAQDLGRVLLNLFNNAFHAVQEKKKRLGDDIQPQVRVSTALRNGGVEIRISDNGTGIPEAVKAKIFQPFFTTKPTGQGTGLGLSLAYDIVTKSHGGSLDVETTEGQGTTFVVRLPA
jgi:signal transduction histidine kinase